MHFANGDFTHGNTPLTTPRTLVVAFGRTEWELTWRPPFFVSSWTELTQRRRIGFGLFVIRKSHG